MSVRVRDFTGIEKRSAHILPIELYWRLNLTSLWLFYWFLLVLLFFGLIFALCLWIPHTESVLLRGMDAQSRSSMEWFRGYYPALLLFGVPFLYVTAKASIGYSRPWAYAALAGWVVETIATLTQAGGIRHLTHILWPAGAELAIALAMTTIFNLSMIAGLWQIARADPADAQLCSTADRFSLFPRSALRRLSILPYGLRFVQRKRRWITFWILLGAGAQVTVAWDLARAMGTATADQRKMLDDCSSRPCYEENSRSDFWRFVISNLVVMSVFPLVGNKILAAGRRRITFSLQQVSQMDPREPILFLRAFRQDRASLPQPRLSLLGRLLLFGRSAKSIDEVLLEEAFQYAPVIAVGSPSDREPPFGAARGYFSNDEWQSEVAKLIRRSRFIVVCADETSGIRWELNEIFEHGDYKKTLFLLPVALNQASENSEAVNTIKRRLCGDALESAGNSDRTTNIGWFWDGDASAVELRSKQCSDLAFAWAIRLFLRTRLQSDS